VANNNLYVLSYRVDEYKNDWENPKFESGIKDKYWYSTRELILYRLNEANNTWSVASNVVQKDCQYAIVDKEFGTHQSYGNVQDFILKKGLTSGKIRILQNGCVVMLLGNYYCIPKYDYTEEYNYNAVAILVPNGDGTYTASRFEPENKKTKQAELAAGDTLKIYESGNTIKLEFWNKIICKENENPDGFVTRNSDSQGKTYRIYYKRTYFTTLNFEIIDKKVTYSGTYKMTK
jgi:hypothetical protein